MADEAAISHPVDGRRQGLLLGLISVAGFMGTLDSSIVNISLPSIAASFQASLPTVSWVTMVYLLTLSATLIAFGRIADLRGYRIIYLAGFTLFTLFSLLCALSGSVHELIGFRILQAIGGAMLGAIGGAMITRYLPAEGRARAFGILTTVVSLGVAAGPVLGGFLTQYLSWHWCFLINIPIGIVAIVGAYAIIPRDPQAGDGGGFDLPGAVILFIALGSLVFGVNMGSSLGWTSSTILEAGALSVFAWGLFVYRERSTASPLIALERFRNLSFTTANIGALLCMLLVTGVSYSIPFYLELDRGIPTDHAGLILASAAFAVMIAGFVGGSVSNRIGARRLCIGAAALMIAAYFSFSTFTSSTSLVLVIGTLVASGAAAGLYIGPNYNMILGYSRPGEEGVVGAVNMTVRNIGSVFAVASYGAVFSIVVAGMHPTAAAGAPRQIPPGLLDPAFHAVYLFGMALAVLLLVFTLVAREPERVVQAHDPGL
jgi:DHA2 family metal-tetracycline-proton antiporter-like MFS transporter